VNALTKCCSGTHSTSNERWKSTGFITTAVAFTSRSAGAPRRSSLVSLLPPMLRLILMGGSSIVAAFSRHRSRPDYQFAIHKIARQRRCLKLTVSRNDRFDLKLGRYHDAGISQVRRLLHATMHHFARNRIILSGSPAPLCRGPAVRAPPPALREKPRAGSSP